MKKFLTVLLALSVVFTYTVGTAFAAASSNAGDSYDAFYKVATDAKTSIGYNTAKYMTTSDAASGVVSEAVVNKAIGDMIEKYRKAIYAASANWDAEWSAVNTDALFKAELFDGAAGSEAYTTLLAAQYDVDLKAAKDALDPLTYTSSVRAQLTTVITALTSGAYAGTANKDGLTGLDSNYNTAVTNFKGATGTAAEILAAKVKAIKTLRQIVVIMNDEVDALATTATTVAQAKSTALNALDDKAGDFIEEANKYYNHKVASNGDPAALTTEELAQQRSLSSDVARMTALFEDQINAIANSDATDAKKISDIKDVQTAFTATFVATATLQTPADPTKGYTALTRTEFNTDVKILDTVELMKAYAKDRADAMKAATNADGTAKYVAANVDVAYQAALDAIAAAAYTDVATNASTLTKATVDTVMDKVSSTDYTLQPYKEAAIKKVTTGSYVKTLWTKERKAKVVAIQDKAKEDILLASSTAAIDSLVKAAQAEMDAILTKAQIDDLEKATDARIAALGYNAVFENYFKAVVGTPATGYSAKTISDAVDQAKQSLKDAVVAKEDAKLTNAQIDAVIKDNTNYTAAIAALTNVQTDAQRVQSAAAVTALITALPSAVAASDKDAVLAAKKAYDDYMDLAGAQLTDISSANRTKMATAMSTLMTLESNTVRNQIRILPTTVTVADADAVKAARTAYDALITTYEEYDGFTAPANLAKLEAAEKALDTVMSKDAADKIAALGANPTEAAVKAARAAYDALSTEGKLAFNAELYATLVNAEKSLDKAVESLKLTASSKAGKGYIKVNWTVKGDAAAADGYQVYRSVKRNSGFGTKPYFTAKAGATSYKNTKALKKGTRYYYKVRAYKVVDGKKVYSDWSNKAYRIAK